MCVCVCVCVYIFPQFTFGVSCETSSFLQHNFTGFNSEFICVCANAFLCTHSNAFLYLYFCSRVLRFYSCVYVCMCV